MKNCVASFCAVMLLIWVADTQTAQAGRFDPETLAENCIIQSQATAQQSMDRISDLKTAAVDRVLELLADGQTKNAERTAMRAINRIRFVRFVGVKRINNNCRRYARFLMRLGRPDLAQEVMAVGEEAIENLRFEAREAIAEINAALDGQPDDGGEYYE